MDFAEVDLVLVKLAIEHASRGFPVGGLEAMAVATLLQFAHTLQIALETAAKEDTDCYNNFMPLAQLILDAIINRQLVKSILQVVDDDGSVKDSASFELKRYRVQVRSLERKLSQLMDKLTWDGKSRASSMEVCNINGRWCIKTFGDNISSTGGLLLSSGSGASSLVEPIAAVPLNDELQQTRVLVAKAEEDVLSKLTDMMLADLDHIQNLLQTIIELDVVTARAKYSIAYGGTFPDIYLPGVRNTDEGYHPLVNSLSTATLSGRSRKAWKLYMAKAYHPLLLQKHHFSIDNARKDVANATADSRRAKLQGKYFPTEDMNLNLAVTKLRVSQLEKELPVPVDFVVSAKTGVLVVTGPNTGGKTISLKTVGLASMMAKTGVYVLAKEPVKIPWFDAVYADIGDEQSLTQSLSTFSGHLTQISAIRSQSTRKSLVLLDEVGAGTNPLEGAALGMSLLESFAKHGSFLTIATTHHGELKTLKYSNDAFENACVEFNEESLKPTYKILWGIPGRSNTITIAERLGLKHSVLDTARKLHGKSSAEINRVIVDMENFKQVFQQHLQNAQNYLVLSRELYEDLVSAKHKIAEHSAIQRNRKLRAVYESEVAEHSILRSKLQMFRESSVAQRAAQIRETDNKRHLYEKIKKSPSAEISNEQIGSLEASEPHGKQIIVPKVGEMVIVPSLGKQAQVLKVEEWKGEVVVQASNIRLRLKLKDIYTQTKTS